MVNTSYLFLMINAYPPVTFRPVHYDVTKIAVFRRTSLLIPCFPRYLTILHYLSCKMTLQWFAQVKYVKYVIENKHPYRFTF